MRCKIKSIRKINIDNETVYDITVPKFHNFILADGTVVHNCDTYQSAQIQQQLEADKFDVSTISVDRLDSETKTQLQYAYLKSTIYDRRLIIYKDCDFLTEEVLGLERLSDGHIEHPEAGTQGSKDAIDAVCGALWNASLHADEIGYEFGESLSVLSEFNNEFTEDIKDSLEQSMLNLYAQNDKQRQTDLMDFGFGKAEEIQFGVSEGLMIW